ncbi:MAG: antibiotic biosynthesis monooxygenase [Alphaproteobacteria bacterium]|nr:antibiotic biosynthesis monooxygenase [Alphaproteobacteria bacterium]
MIIVQGEARFHPDDMPMLRKAGAEMMAATRQEPGNLAYAFAEDVASPGLVHIVERWADGAALEAHFKTPHMAAFNAALGQARVLALKVCAYDASGERLLAGG